MNKVPKPPADLSAEGRKLWRAILADWGIADSAHLAVLHVGLQALDRAARCRAAIDAEGEVVQDRFKQKKPHPLLSAERDARSSFFQAVKTLGLDPSEVQ